MPRDEYYQVLEEVPRVRKDLGECPLGYSVFPDRWYAGCYERHQRRALQDGCRSRRRMFFAVRYGATIKPFNKEVSQEVIGDAEVITCRPADLIPDELDTLRG